jgi:hypothetical protein
MKAVFFRTSLRLVSLAWLVACGNSGTPGGDGAAGATATGGAGGSPLVDGGDAEGGAAGGQAGSGGAPPDGGSCENVLPAPETFVMPRCAVGSAVKGGGPIPDGVYELVDYTITGSYCPFPMPPPASRVFRVSGPALVGVDAIIPSAVAQPVVSRWSAQVQYFGSTINFSFSCGGSPFGTSFTVERDRVWFNVFDGVNNVTDTWHFRKR